MERPFYDTSEDRTNLVPSLQQDAPWVHFPDAGAGVDDAAGAPQPLSIGANQYPYGIYYEGHGYNVMDPDTMSMGYPGIHSTPSNQGLAPRFASHPYLASKIEGFAPFHGYGAMDQTYATANMAYGANVAYGTTSAAYSADTITGNLTEGGWPSTDPVSTLIGYDHGALNTGVYPPIPNPTLAPGTITTVQGGYESAVTNTDSSRPQCPTCNTTFKRASDLARHQKKHQADRPFKCLVPGCSFKGAYRKDKLDAHVKSCHRRGAA